MGNAPDPLHEKGASRDRVKVCFLLPLLPPVAYWRNHAFCSLSSSLAEVSYWPCLLFGTEMPIGVLIILIPNR